MANTKISALTANTNPNWSEEFVYAYNNANGKISLNTMKTFAAADSQPTLVSGVNIKTINSQSILWSGNIDVSWGGGGGWSPTELGGDANIWELSEWVYETTYDLYYISGQKVPVIWASQSVKKQLLFVTENSEWTKWFFVFNAWSKSATNIYSWYASYWYSVSASNWVCNQLWARDAMFNNATATMSASIDAIIGWEFTQIVSEITSGTNDLRISTSNPPYAWITYTFYISSVASGETYTITLWTWVTNPLWITLPTNSNKGCVITVLTTSTTTWIVTSCQMMQ